MGRDYGLDIDQVMMESLGNDQGSEYLWVFSY